MEAEGTELELPRTGGALLSFSHVTLVSLLLLGTSGSWVCYGSMRRLSVNYQTGLADCTPLTSQRRGILNKLTECIWMRAGQQVHPTFSSSPVPTPNILLLQTVLYMHAICEM